MPSKKQTKDYKQYPKVYWISSDDDNEYSKIQSKFANRKEIYKVSKFYIGDDEKEFINLNLTCELKQEEFDKLASNINKFLEKEFKVFYKFGDTKYTFTPNQSTLNINEFIKFIDD